MADLSRVCTGLGLSFYPAQTMEHAPAVRRQPQILWGVAPVPPLHLGYDRAIRIIRALLAQKMRVSILLADYHAVLAYGLDIEATRHRKAYYYNYLKHMCGDGVSFQEGTQFQSRQAYAEMLYNWQRIATVADVKAALPSAVAKSLNVQTNVISTYTYTLVQVIDPLYLGVDAVMGDQGQKKIYDLGPLLMKKSSRNAVTSDRRGTAYPAQIYYDVGHDIKGMPIFQSKGSTRISIHETKDSLTRKIRDIYAPPPGQPEAEGRVNALFSLFRDSVFPWVEEPVRIADVRGKIHDYTGSEDFERDYAARLLHPNDCKQALLGTLAARLERTQAAMGTANCSWIDMSKVR
jgi:tyrosyl-tRNA synthetase